MFCEKCGNSMSEEAKFCNKCGTPILISTTQVELQENKKDALPSELKKWNWGASLLGWIWAVGNKAYLMAILGIIIILIPYVGWLVSIILFGIKGNEWAWESKKWDNLEHFKRVQKLWRNWAIGITLVILIPMVLFLVAPLFTTTDNNTTNDIEATYKSDDVKHVANKTQVSDLRFEKISETVVNILCPYSSEPFAIDSNGTGGSGTIFDSSGLIVSNSHIIPQDEEVLDVSEDGCFVILPDNETGSPKEIYLATPLVFNDLSDEYDLAFLTIYDVYSDEDGQYGQYPNDFPSFDDTDYCEDEQIKLGENVRVLGYPISSGGYNLTITDGVVSSFTDDGLILTSAKIDQGNSGGLAIDKDGCMIGIPVAVSEGQYDNLGIIIPPSMIADFINEVDKQLN